MSAEFPINIIQTGDCLTHGEYIRHSVFKRSVNFINSNGAFCLLTNDINNSAPNSITIECEHIPEFQSINLTEKIIHFNDQEINRKHIPVYKSNLDITGLNALNLANNLTNIIQHYRKDFPEKSLAFLLFPENARYFEKGFDKAFFDNSYSSYLKILSGNIIEGVIKIKGTGFGLTPSGDDFITGLLFGLHINEIIYKINLTPVRNDVYNAALGENPFTNSFLYYAKNANYFFRLKKFVTLLSEKKTGDLDDALKLLFSVGATSGADLLTGLIISIKNSVGV